MNPLLDELKKISVELQTHWGETIDLWNDHVRDRVEKNYIEDFGNDIQLCLTGKYGSERTYGRGMFDLFEFIEKASKKLSWYSGQEVSFDASGEHQKTICYADNERHKRRYLDEDDENMMVDYDNYPD